VRQGHGPLLRQSRPDAGWRLTGCRAWSGGGRELSLACVIGGRRVSATSHAAPFSLASFHSRHIRRSRPNSIIFRDGRRPRGAIGDYAGGRHGRAAPGDRVRLCSVRPVYLARTGAFAIVCGRKSSIVGR